MTRALLALFLALSASAAWGQYPMVPAYSQPFYGSPAFSSYGNGGYGGYGGGYGAYGPYGGYGNYGGYGGFGGYGFGARGYYPPNPFGNMNWLPPNAPSPYYVTPSGPQYRELARQREQAKYVELMLLNGGQK